MAGDALAPYIARASAALPLSVLINVVMIAHEEGKKCLFPQKDSARKYKFCVRIFFTISMPWSLLGHRESMSYTSSELHFTDGSWDHKSIPQNIYTLIWFYSSSQVTNVFTP